MTRPVRLFLFFCAGIYAAYMLATGALETALALTWTTPPLERLRGPEAIKIYMSGVALDPDNAWYHGMLGSHLSILAAERKDGSLFSEAEAHVRRAIELEPSLDTHHTTLAVVLARHYRSTGDGRLLAGVMTAAKAAVELDPLDSSNRKILDALLVAANRASIR